MNEWKGRRRKGVAEGDDGCGCGGKNKGYTVGIERGRIG